MNFFLSFFLLFAITVNFAQSTDTKTYPNYKIHYRFATPDPWEDNFWKWDNQDDSYWRKANSTAELSIAIAKEKPAEVFIRLEVNHTGCIPNCRT